MPGLFGEVKAEFNVIGELQDRRVITSEKMKDWALYIYKIAAKGCTLEVQVSKDDYETAVLKAPYQVLGSITVEAGRTKLVGESIKLLAKP